MGAHHHRESAVERPQGVQPPNTAGGNTTRGETALGETHPPTGLYIHTYISTGAVRGVAPSMVEQARQLTPQRGTVAHLESGGGLSPDVHVVGCKILGKENSPPIFYFFCPPPLSVSQGQPEVDPTIDQNGRSG